MGPWRRVECVGWRPLTAIGVAVALVAACGGGGDDPDEGGTGKPKRGGSLNYALGAETPGGFCLPEAQLASGIPVATAVYDTLMVPNVDDEYVPSLARSVEPNEDFTKWTIKLREGIEFHDGSPLDAEVVKNNLDAYRGTRPPRKPLLFLFVLQNIADTRVVDDMTVEVTTMTPWVAFPAYLYASGRLGIVAQSQLDDTETCDRKLIGTGPFKFVEFVVNDHLTVRRNPKYWQTAPDGKPYPYLDEIVFRPVADEGQRVNGLQSGELDVITTGGGRILANLRELADQDLVDVNETKQPNLVSYTMFNASKPPFDDVNVRRAFAHGIDRESNNEILNDGLFEIADGPFAPGGLGYVKDAGFPEHDVDKAKELIADYEERTGSQLKVTLTTTSSPEVIEGAQLLQGQAEEFGVEVNLKSVDQGTIINNAISGDFQFVLWTNSHPGGDPDEQYLWWKSGSPTNFGRITDPEIDRLLDEGRVEPDREKRQEIYGDVMRQFADQAWNVWSTYTVEALATAPNVNGILPPETPSGDDPYYLQVIGHPSYAMWLD